MTQAPASGAAPRRGDPANPRAGPPAIRRLSPPRPPRRRLRDAREFLPAALEVLETPASPLGRTTALVLCALVVAATAWAFLGTVDVVAVARGSVVPVGGVKTVQSLEAGVVRAVHVRSGQRVAAGDTLVELDPTEPEVDRDRLRRDRMEAALEAARLEAMRDGLEGGNAAWTPPPGADPTLAALHADRLRTELALHAARLANFDAERARRAAERDALAAELAKRRATLPIVAEREAALRALEEQGHTPRAVWLEANARLVENRHDIDILTHRLARAQADVDAAELDARVFADDETRLLLASLQEARRRREQGDILLRAADRRAHRQTLRAPIAGTVEQLAVSTVGGVVAPGEPLLVIVPDTDRFEVRASVLNKDKGFVHPGQKAAVKLDAFPFARHGFIEGTVRRLAADAVEDPAQGLVYDARVALDRNAIRIDGQDTPLVPGMAVTLEIRTGERRIIDFILSPLRQYENEALRER